VVGAEAGDSRMIGDRINSEEAKEAAVKEAASEHEFATVFLNIGIFLSFRVILI